MWLGCLIWERFKGGKCWIWISQPNVTTASEHLLNSGLRQKRGELYVGGLLKEGFSWDLIAAPGLFPACSPLWGWLKPPYPLQMDDLNPLSIESGWLKPPMHWKWTESPLFGTNGNIFCKVSRDMALRGQPLLDASKFQIWKLGNLTSLLIILHDKILCSPCVSSHFPSQKVFH